MFVQLSNGKCVNLDNVLSFDITPAGNAQASLIVEYISADEGGACIDYLNHKSHEDAIAERDSLLQGLLKDSSPKPDYKKSAQITLLREAKQYALLKTTGGYIENGKVITPARGDVEMVEKHFVDKLLWAARDWLRECTLMGSEEI